MPDELVTTIRPLMDEALADQNRGTTLLRGHLAKQVARLDVKEENLLDLAADSTVPQDKIKARLRVIGHEREQLTRQLDQATGDLAVGQAVISAAIDPVGRRSGAVPPSR